MQTLESNDLVIIFYEPLRNRMAGSFQMSAQEMAILWLLKIVAFRQTQFSCHLLTE